MTWNLDQQHIDLGFSAKHLMITTVKGRFADVEAELAIDEERPEASRVTATVAVASLSTDNAERDAHLMSADFFDVEHYPTMTFASTAVRRTGADRVELEGDLTIRDVTRRVTLAGELTGPITSPWGDRRAGVSLTGEIDREDFGLTWNMALEAGGVLVSRKVKLHLDAEVAETVAVVA